MVTAGIATASSSQEAKSVQIYVTHHSGTFAREAKSISVFKVITASMVGYASSDSLWIEFQGSVNTSKEHLRI